MSQTKTSPAVETHGYEFVGRAKERCPCPALNAMANHGYLPRDGQNIGLWQLISALREVYNLSYPLAIFLSVMGMLLCGKWWSLPWTINLHDLSRHNRIEHDCSLTHPDAEHPSDEFAPNRVSFTLLRRLLDISTSGQLSLDDFVQARIRRALEDKKPLDAVHKEIAHGEAALTLLIFGAKGVDGSDSSRLVPRSFVEQWFGQDKLPDGWTKPATQIGLVQTAKMSAEIKAAILKEDWIYRSA